ncbi:MAG: HDOD domain-containing protein [Chloroflexota bacterium]
MNREAPERELDNNSGLGLQITKKMLRSLAPLPDTAIQLLSLLNDPEVSLRKVADLAVRDVGISAALLRMANSAVFGLRGKVGNISDALRVIGTSQARLLVLASGVAQTAQRELPLYGLPANGFMRHSELTANLTMVVALEAHYPNIGLAYSAGLLHDLGKVILNGLAVKQAEGTRIVPIADMMRTRKLTLLEAETVLFGADHAEVTCQLAELWSLPEELGAAIAVHHHPVQADPNNMLPYCLMLSNGLAAEIDPSYLQLSEQQDTTLPNWLSRAKVNDTAVHCGYPAGRPT